MPTCRVSLICTLKNEVSNIRDFLDSINSQSRAPDELIIADGGSTDGTVDVIKSYSTINTTYPIKVIICEGANIAQGRNIAIENASFDIIACTDLGCVLDKDWLKNIVRPFEEKPEADVVSGWYEPDARTKFERITADVICPKLNAVIKNQSKFLPSSRSVAYKKSCWKAVGGYPTWLYTAEDTLYDINLKKAGYRFVFAPTAIVYWRMRSNLKSIFKQYFLYAKGDAQAGTNTEYYVILISGLIATSFVLIGSLYHSIFVIGLLVIPTLYCLFWFWKKKINFCEAPLFKIFIQGLIDAAKIIGFSSGKLTRNYKSN